MSHRRRSPAALVAYALLVHGCTLPELRVYDRDASAEASDAVVDTARPDVPLITLRPTPSCPDVNERGCGRVYVRGGTFTLGSESDPTASPPQPEIRVSDILFDAAEVTVRRFRRFQEYVEQQVKTTGVPPRLSTPYPNDIPVTVAPGRLEPPLLGTAAGCNRLDSTLDEHPINCVDFFVAMGFCIWDRGRLPTEAEWEWVARWSGEPEGSSGRTYPWGNDAPTERCDLAHWSPGMCNGDDGRPTRRVQSLPGGAANGVYDLAGNVSEWVGDIFTAYAPTSAPNECWGLGAQRDPFCIVPVVRNRVARGGSYSVIPTDIHRLRTFFRREASPDPRESFAGFRCVRLVVE